MVSFAMKMNCNNLQSESNSLESELVSLNKVKSANEYAIKELDANHQMSKKFGHTKDILTETKEQLKEKQDLFREQEREMREQHAGMIEIEEKCRKFAQLLAHNKTVENHAVTDFDSNEISKIKNEVNVLEESKNQQEAELKKNLRKLQFDIDEAELQRNIISVKLKEKEQEIRLNDLRIKELTRSMPHRSLKPLSRPRDDEGKGRSRVSTYYPENPNSKSQLFSANKLSKVNSQTQFKLKKLKVKHEKLPKLVVNDIVEEADELEYKEAKSEQEVLKSPKISESQSTKVQPANQNVSHKRNETDNIKQSIKNTRVEG